MISVKFDPTQTFELKDGNLQFDSQTTLNFSNWKKVRVVKNSDGDFFLEAETGDLSSIGDTSEPKYFSLRWDEEVWSKNFDAASPGKGQILLANFSMVDTALGAEIGIVGIGLSDVSDIKPDTQPSDHKLFYGLNAYFEDSQDWRLAIKYVPASTNLNGYYLMEIHPDVKHRIRIKK